MRREWNLRKNCSLTPGQLALAYAVLCALSLLVGGISAVAGAWLILVFTVLELMAVASAFLHYAVHATDHEQIVLDGDRLIIERFDGSKHHAVQFDVCWTRLMVPRHPEDLIALRQHDVNVEFGRFVGWPARRMLALELNAVLHDKTLQHGQGA